MTKEIEMFVKERNEALEEYSVKKLCKLMKKYQDKKTYDDFMSASDLVKEATLCKMICCVPAISDKTRKRAEEFLDKHKMTRGIR